MVLYEGTRSSENSTYLCVFLSHKGLRLFGSPSLYHTQISRGQTYNEASWGKKVRSQGWFSELLLIELLQELFAVKSKCNIRKQCCSLFVCSYLSKLNFYYL
jgi:hypothetical protein